MLSDIFVKMCILSPKHCFTSKFKSKKAFDPFLGKIFQIFKKLSNFPQKRVKIDNSCHKKYFVLYIFEYLRYGLVFYVEQRVSTIVLEKNYFFRFEVVPTSFFENKQKSLKSQIFISFPYDPSEYSEVGNFKFLFAKWF